MPSAIGMLVGEFAYSLRSGLDQLAWHAVARDEELVNPCGDTGRLESEMACKAIRERDELSQMVANRPRPRQRLFAAHVALGLSYGESARRAGYHEDHGNRLMRKPAIRERVEELRDATEEERFLAGIQAELLMLYDRVPKESEGANGSANIKLQLRILKEVEKVSGWSGPRK
jgi:hypothetical protein